MFLTVVYDPSVWTTFGYTVQRYIGAASTIGIRVLAIIVGVKLLMKVLRWFMK